MRASPQACAAYFERLFLIRLRRVLSFARSFLATAFRIMFMPASGLIGSPSMIGEGALPAALSKPFLLKIILMVGLRNTTVACPAIFKFEMAVFGQNCKDQKTLDAVRFS